MQSIICLIEDDEIIGDSLCDRFGLEGFSVDWHRTGQEGLRAISNKRYDLVISDIRLPDASGDEIFERLMRETRVLPPSFSSLRMHRLIAPCACLNSAQQITSQNRSTSTS